MKVCCVTSTGRGLAQEFTLHFPKSFDEQHALFEQGATVLQLRVECIGGRIIQTWMTNDHDLVVKGEAHVQVPSHPAHPRQP